MGKAAKKNYGKAAALRQGPDWILLGLALAGMAIAAYLSLEAWRGRTVAGCAAGSACDIVLASQWAKLFGVPTSLWGFLAYASLAAIAFIRRAEIQWKLAFVVSLFGVLYSAYLTGAALLALKAACPYCLSSFAVMTAALAVTIYRRPAGPGNFSNFQWTAWLAKTVSAALAVILALHLYYIGAWGDSKLYALADHLTKIDAKFYGASWCPHCREQKRVFGDAAGRLPYVECSPEGPNSPQAPACDAMHIEVYPTWIINGRRYEGALMPDDLGKLSGFQNQ